MADDPVPLDAYRPHVSGEVRCRACGHEWIGIARAGSVGLECLECGTFQGIWKHPIADSKRPRWECHCGNYAFSLHPEGVIVCTYCGERQTNVWGNDKTPA